VIVLMVPVTMEFKPDPWTAPRGHVERL